MRNSVRILNRTREVVLGTRVELADTWWTRLRGYLGRKNPPVLGEGILFVSCNAIHTYGMQFELDVIFLDAGGSVLQAISDMRPWTRSKRVAGARYVLEVPSGTIRRTGTSIGDAFTWRPLQAPALKSPEVL
jgi:uncharacterized membrane protein (UPF0127 family)